MKHTEIDKMITEYATTLLEARRTYDIKLEAENRKILKADIEDHTNSQLRATLERLKENSIKTERLSYMPVKDHDPIRNWPIIQQPCFIVPAVFFDEELSKLEEGK